MPFEGTDGSITSVERRQRADAMVVPELKLQ
jgi:hypothetical protein